jgi:hypothetical protein
MLNRAEHSSEAAAARLADTLEGDIEALRTAFLAVFGPRIRPFGNRSRGVVGVSDGNEGVQWNAGIDLRAAERFASVNLEGMAYDGWPVARMIQRELERPTLFEVVTRMGDPDPIQVSWRRDCWQGAGARLLIEERNLGDTPILLSRLTPQGWGQTLAEALECLDVSRNYRGRAMQSVTLKKSGRKIQREVSPHLNFEIRWPSGVVGSFDWHTFLAGAKERLQPLYAWTTERAGGGPGIKGGPALS